MIRLVTYSVAALVIVFLMGSRADGGMIYACDAALRPCSDMSLEARHVPGWWVNTPMQTAMITINDAPALNNEFLISPEQDTKLSFSGRQNMGSPMPLADLSTMSDYSSSLQFVAPASDVTLLGWLWQAVMLSTDIWTRNAAYVPPQLIQRDSFNPTERIEVPALGDTRDGGVPAIQWAHTQVSTGMSITPLRRPRHDSPDNFPLNTFPRDALPSATGSEIVTRTLKDNTNEGNSKVGRDDARQPRARQG